MTFFIQLRPAKFVFIFLNSVHFYIFKQKLKSKILFQQSTLNLPKKILEDRKRSRFFLNRRKSTVNRHYTTKNISLVLMHILPSIFGLNFLSINLLLSLIGSNRLFRKCHGLKCLRCSMCINLLINEHKRWICISD